MSLTKSPSDVPDSPAHQKINYFTSSAAVFRGYFGKLWPVFLLVLFMIAFWPIFAFRKSIVFNPSVFVSEWVKISIEGMLLFLILEIVRHRSSTFTTRRTLLDLVMTNYIIPIQRMSELLNDFREALRSGVSAEVMRVIDSVWSNWSMIDHALSDSALSVFSNELEVSTRLLRQRNALDLMRCKSILDSLATVQKLESLNETEFKELLERLEVFLKDVKSLYDAANNLGGNK